MSLNTDAGKYDLLSEDQAIYNASWAVYWLSDVLWLELRGGVQVDPGVEMIELPGRIDAANAMAISAWPDSGARVWPPLGIVGWIESILS